MLISNGGTRHIDLSTYVGCPAVDVVTSYSDFYFFEWSVFVSGLVSKALKISGFHLLSMMTV